MEKDISLKISFVYIKFPAKQSNNQTNLALGETYHAPVLHGPGVADGRKVRGRRETVRSCFPESHVVKGGEAERWKKKKCVAIDEVKENLKTGSLKRDGDNDLRIFVLKKGGRKEKKRTI